MRSHAHQVRTLVGISLFAFLLSGCQSKVFAGFTYGGGGKTYSAEPALYSEQGEGFKLEVGSPAEPCFLLLTCASRTQRQAIPVSGGEVKIPDQEKAELSWGEVVLQSHQGELVHGSFELKAKAPDGREYPVVGSFTARTL